MLVQFARHGHDSRDICVFRKLFRDNFCFLDVGVVGSACDMPQAGLEQTTGTAGGYDLPSILTVRTQMCARCG